MSTTMEFKRYRRSAIAEMADWSEDVDMTGVSISDADRASGSPKVGDKIARNPDNHKDRWLVAAAYFRKNFELIEVESVDPDPAPTIRRGATGAP